MQGHKSESSALDEMQNERLQCIATVADCSKRPDCKRRTHVVRNVYAFVRDNVYAVVPKWEARRLHFPVYINAKV